jgi:hypothetical protein
MNFPLITFHRARWIVDCPEALRKPATQCVEFLKAEVGASSPCCQTSTASRCLTQSN